MATKLGFEQLRAQIDRLRKDSLDVVANANKIVYGGVQKLADKELKALNDYYKSAVASIKAARRDNLKDAAQKQIDLLQDTVNQVIGHARESVGIVAEARSELAKLVQNSARGASIAESALEKAVTPARKALEKAKSKAEKAGSQATRAVKDAKKSAEKEIKKIERTIRKDVKTVEAKVGKAAKQVEKTLGLAPPSPAKKAGDAAKAVGKKVASEAKAKTAAVKKVVARATPVPSPDSRASRATSKAKQTVTEAVESASSAVSNAVTAVVDAVKSAG